MTDNIAFPTSTQAYVRERAYEKKFPALNYAEFVPIDNDVNPDADSIVTMAVETTGEARIVSQGSAGSNLPLASFKASMDTVNIIDWEFGYEVTQKDMRVERNSGSVKPQQQKVNASMRAYHSSLHRMVMVGNTDLGLTGLTNTDFNAAPGTIRDWSASATTASQITDDVGAMIQEIIDNTLGAMNPNVLALPLKSYAAMVTKKFANTGQTALAAVRETAREMLDGEELQLIRTPDLATKSVMYARDPDVLGMSIAKVIDFLPEQPKGTGFVVPCLWRASSLAIYDMAAFSQKTTAT